MQCMEVDAFVWPVGLEPTIQPRRAEASAAGLAEGRSTRSTHRFSRAQGCQGPVASGAIRPLLRPLHPALLDAPRPASVRPSSSWHF